MLRFLRGGRRTAGIWWLIIFGTAVTFVIGFSVAPNLGGGQKATATSALGTVNGEPISFADYQRTLTQLQANYRSQYNREPAGRDANIMKEQAWTQLVTEAVILQEAEKQGYKVTDDEVLFAVRNAPPPWVRSEAAFQTNGQFDLRKYQQALGDPSVNWSPLEETMRRMIPGQKLEANLLSTVKFSEPELRRAFQNQYETAIVTVARWNPSGGAIDTSGFTDAAMRAWYQQHIGRFAGPPRSQAVVVRLPKSIRPEEQKATEERAKDLVRQIRGGADFAQIARDQSDDPSAARGGDLGQDIKLSQVSADMKAKVTAVADSAVLDPVVTGNRVYILKVARRQGGADPTFAASQIVLTIQPSEDARAQDAEKIHKLREAAAKKGLGPAAAAMGIAAQETGWFAQNMMVPQLMDLPQAQQFAMVAKKGSLSPTYDTGPALVVVQVKEHDPAGPRQYEEVRAGVRGQMELEERLKAPQAAAVRALAQIRAGKPFEAAVKAEGAAAVERTQPFSRLAPASQLARSARAVGVAFGLPIGQTGGPVEAPSAILLVRKDAADMSAAARYDSLKATVSQSLLNERQNRTFSAWLEWLRDRSQVVDKRGDVLEAQ